MMERSRLVQEKQCVCVCGRMENVINGKLEDLNADLLAEVFSFLSSKDLAEVMLVSKYWERSVLEGSGLWRQVTVALKWDTWSRRAKGHNFMCKLLAAAKEVEFKYCCCFHNEHNEHIESVGGVLGSNLQFLEIPHHSVSSAFFPILVSQCPHLKTLLMDGEPTGMDPIDIRHPQLETLMLRCLKPRMLTIDCPNLTHLSTGATTNYPQEISMVNRHFPSFNCPRLTNLILSRVHCAVAVWNFLAAHAPNIKWLQVYCSKENHLSALTGFKALQVLRVKGESRGTPPHFDFGQWPLLEGILLNGDMYPTNPQEVRHARLKELRIVDPLGCTSLVLDCPSLEDLRLHGNLFGEECTKTLDSSCPKLKRFKLERVLDSRIMDMMGRPKVPGMSEFVHETVEELECHSLLPQIKRIACPKLTKLVLGWKVDLQEAELAFPVVECLNLLHLEIHGYYMWMSSLPSILALLPDLESLTVGTLWIGKEKDVVLVHSRIKDFVLAKRASTSPSLVLIMPSLVHVDIGGSLIQVLEVISMAKTVTVDFDRYFFKPMQRRRVFEGGKMKNVDLSDAE